MEKEESTLIQLLFVIFTLDNKQCVSLFWCISTCLLPRSLSKKHMQTKCCELPLLVYAQTLAWKPALHDNIAKLRGIWLCILFFPCFVARLYCSSHHWLDFFLSSISLLLCFSFILSLCLIGECFYPCLFTLSLLFLHYLLPSYLILS